MKMEVTIEWLLEVLEDAEPDADIAEVHHCGSYAEAKDAAENFYTGQPIVIGLVRDVGNDEEGLVDRQWAYLKDGKLPERFDWGGGEDGGAKVPARYHKEIAA